MIAIIAASLIGAAITMAYGSDTDLWWRVPLATALTVLAVTTFAVLHRFWEGDCNNTVRDIIRTSLKK